jgi:dTDP-4-amino-4,6-dideoxygalactose transaminase
MLKMETAPWPVFGDDEIAAVNAVLKSGKVNAWTGEQVKVFEKEFSEYIGVEYAIATPNGSLALELALHVLNIGNDDEVIVTPRSFIASASCIVLKGATPVFADVDVESQNITAESIQKVITSKTRAIIIVHLAGWPCDIDAILKIAKEKNIYVIEDCAQALGAKYKGNPVGSFGDVSIFSFCQDKIITTGGEGGMLATNDESLFRRAWSFKEHGKDYEKSQKSNVTREFSWLHDSFGSNLRITEMQAAIGRIQLKKLDGWLIQRKKNAQQLTKCFSKIKSLRVTTPDEIISHAYYKYYVFIRPEMLKQEWNRIRILNAIIKEGVPCFTGSCPEIYKEKAFKDYQGSIERLPIAKELGETSLMFLVHPTLGEKEMGCVCIVVNKVMQEATL